MTDSPKPKAGKTALPAPALIPRQPERRKTAGSSWSEYHEGSAIPAITESADRLFHAFQGRFSLGLSPASLMLAYLDWLVHLGNSAGKMTEMSQNAMAKSLRFSIWASRTARQPAAEPFIEPLPQDSRFAKEEWKEYPFNVYYQAFLLVEQWWHYATTDVRGVSRHHQDVVSFTARQLLDIFSPSNLPWLNPEVIKATLEQGGANLKRGAEKFTQDLERGLSGRGPAALANFQVGEDLACTPGKVVYRNQLIELIQYTQTTPQTHAEPILIVPAWIMKYYILDLSPKNSMVSFLLSRGYTVFMISWRNPGPAERDMGLEDYLRLGVMDSLQAINTITKSQHVHSAGYCLGGTLLSMAAATMARNGDDRLKTITLLAAQTDFEEAGEIMLFTDESQVTFLEDMMWDQGYLDTKQMAGAFQLLRSNDLIWSKILKEYVLGEPETMNDLMAWNADATRMPYRMHSEYLRSLFVENDLSKGRFQVGGRPISLTDIRAPICAVGTTKDHVAPWKSVFKISILTDTDVTFILTAGGHNAGIVSEPGHPHRSYQIDTRQDLSPYVAPETWAQITPKVQGSWWLAWADWLDRNSAPGLTAPPPMGDREAGYPALYDAPGEYVLMR